MEHANTTAEALRRISVRRPYFGLEQLETVGDGMVTAVVPSHPPSAPEVGAVEAAQVARHLAILGSCAAALARDDDKRHHYLATRAHFARLWNAPRSNDAPLLAEAVASWVDRRTVRSLIKLGDENGHGLNMLDVEYTVLAPKMFTRLHPPIGDGSSRGVADSPASVIDDPALPFDIEHTADGIEVRCGPIPSALCAGHFPDYPAAPVAIVMGQLCRAAGLGLIDHLGYQNSGYRIEEGHVDAQRLAAAGQDLVLRATYDRPVPGGHQMLGMALADGDVVGEVAVTLSIHTLEPDPSDDDTNDQDTFDQGTHDQGTPEPMATDRARAAHNLVDTPAGS